MAELDDQESFDITNQPLHTLVSCVSSDSNASSGQKKDNTPGANTTRGRTVSKPPSPQHNTSEPERTEGDQQPLYEVDRIMDHRSRGGHIQYKVRWAGFGAQSDTWAYWEDFSQPDTIIHDYYMNLMRKKVKYLFNMHI